MEALQMDTCFLFPEESRDSVVWVVIVFGEPLPFGKKVRSLKRLLFTAFSVLNHDRFCPLIKLFSRKGWEKPQKYTF